MSNQIHIQYYKSPYGNLVIGSFNKQLVLCDWQFRKMRKPIDQRICTALDAVFVEKPCEIIDQTIVQLNAYFKQEITEFNLPLHFVGTDFQQKVWTALLQIPYGKTSTYLQQAITLKNALAIRAVATANGANALAIIVPCHRIIGSDGSLVGYAGGLSVKQKLLTLEGASSCNKNQQQLSLQF